MLKKFLFFVLLIIVLISLNWFKELVAAEPPLNQDKTLLSKELESLKDSRSEEDQYVSPEIFEETNDTLISYINSKPNSNVNDFTSNVELIPFEKLLPFGNELFSGQREDNSPIAIASAGDYILGPGDNVIIYLWGRVEKEYNLVLDREGKVFIPSVGELIGWGLNLDQFTQKAHKKFSKVYSKFELTVSLGKIRSIRIYVTGEVHNPDAYTVSSLASLFSALVAAGGPNERGSMRNVKLMRLGEQVAIVDLYDFLLFGNNSSDIQLQSGDVIFVPVAKLQVAIRGEVKRPALYELKDIQTAPELLELAGGATSRAHLRRVMLERISHDEEWEVVDLNLNSDGPEKSISIPLKDGDRLTVNSFFDFKKNQVGIFGHVQHPGYYERTDSTRVSDLVKQGWLQPYDVYLSRADLFRRHEDWRMEVIPINLELALSSDPDHNRLLSDLDSLHIRSIADVHWDKSVYIEGAIKNPGKYQFYDRMTVADLIFLAGSYKREASKNSAEIARLDSRGQMELFQITLDNKNADTIYLCEEDHLYIRQIPQWQENPTITIDGEVMYPGIYSLSGHDETLNHLLERAGGFTPNAFPPGIIWERASIGKNLERVGIRDMIDRSQPLKADSTGKLVKQSILEYDSTSMNRIIIDIDRVLANHQDLDNICLKPNDCIFVPSVPSGVSVMGAVGANGTIRYEKNRKVKHYVKMAGNFTRQADKGETKLIRANGEIVTGKSSLGKKVNLGDVIIVPSKIEKNKNWLRTFASVMSATTGVLTSVYIVSKL